MQKELLQGQTGQNQSQSQREREEFCCKYCGTPLSEDDLFCPECGEKVKGEEKSCPVCGTSSTSDFCPECGYRIVPAICPECGNKCHYDLCEKCGAVINPVYEQAVMEKFEEPAAMSQEEEEEIKKVFEERISDEAEEFIKRVEKHQRQQKIKNFVGSREKRIEKVFGKSPIEYVVPDLEEEAFMMKAYEELNKIVRAKDEAIKQNQIKNDFVEISKESQKQYEELQNRSKEICNTLKKDIKDAKVLEEKLIEEEKKRKEEEQRIKAKEEAKKKKAEEKARLNSILGLYEMFYECGRSEIYIKSFDGNEYKVYAKIDFYGGGSLIRICSATLKGRDFHITVKKVFADFETNTNRSENYYNGELVRNIITGFWNGCSRSKYYKIS